MGRRERWAIGLVGLLVLGAAGAQENPAAPLFAVAAGPTTSITPAIVRRIERAFTNTCAVSENPSFVEGREFWGGGMSPAISVLSRLKYSFGIEPAGPVTTVLTRAPSHGRVNMIGLDDQSFPGVTLEAFQYTPTRDFLGNDRVAFAVTVNGQKFRISYVIHVQRQLDDEVCRPPGEDRGALAADVRLALDDMARLRPAARSSSS